MAPLSRGQLLALARLGAEARLAQLDMEIAAIKSAYPEIAARGRGPAGKPRPAAQAKPRKAYHMSSAARKAASERMKKFWEQRRAAAGAAQGAPQEARPAEANEKTAPVRKARARKAAKPVRKSAKKR